MLWCLDYPAHRYEVQILANAVWFRKYETIFSRDLHCPRTAGEYVEFGDMQKSQSAHSLGNGVIVHCVVKRDRAKSRNREEARVAVEEHLVLTAGRSGPGILLPCCERQYIRPGEYGHDVLRNYLSEFGDVVPVHGVADAELKVWTTRSNALLIGKFDQSRYQQDMVQAAIGAVKMMRT